MRATLLSWLAAFILIFGLNGVFHTFVAAQLYDPALRGITLLMAQANPLLVALVDVVLVAVMAYFILRKASQVQRSEAANAGALIGLAASCTYNLVNAALIPNWPIMAGVADVLWHVMLGAAGGVLMAWVYNAVARKNKHVTARG